MIDFICKAPEVLSYCRTFHIIYSKCFFLIVAFCFNEAMISDTTFLPKYTFSGFTVYTKYFFPFFLKKTFYKDQNTMLHAIRTIKKSLYVASAQRYQRRRMRSKGQKGQSTAVFPWCNTTAQESSRTHKKRCSYIHVKLSMSPSS